MSEQIVWRPTPEYVERAKITRLMRRLGVRTLDELQRRSVDDPEWYWRGVIDDLGIRFTAPFSRVLDDARGAAWPRWFVGGRLNFADNCLDRHVDAGRGGKPALVWEGDDGTSRTLT
jgi:acetyl-CoA synthetase